MKTDSDRDDDGRRRPVVDLQGRLDKIRYSKNPMAGDLVGRPTTDRISSSSSFDHRAMIIEMLQRAVDNNRNFVADLATLIGLHHRQGSNIGQILQRWKWSDELKSDVVTMAKIYQISSLNERTQYRNAPTLSRIVQSFPHVSLWVSSEIYANPQLRMSLRHWVSDKELGAEVSFYFKKCFYPAMINVEKCGVKALAGLVLFNLCHTRSIINSTPAEDIMTGRMTVIGAFLLSCKIAARIIEEDLAPRKSKQQFTEFVKTLPVTPELLNLVWKTVIGDEKIMLTQVTSLTRFHEKVLSEQPLNLQKWSNLMEGYDAENFVLSETNR